MMTVMVNRLPVSVKAFSASADYLGYTGPVQGLAPTSIYNTKKRVRTTWSTLHYRLH